MSEHDQAKPVAHWSPTELEAEFVRQIRELVACGFIKGNEEWIEPLSQKALTLQVVKHEGLLPFIVVLPNVNIMSEIPQRLMPFHRIDGMAQEIKIIKTVTGIPETPYLYTPSVNTSAPTSLTPEYAASIREPVATEVEGFFFALLNPNLGKEGGVVCLGSKFPAFVAPKTDALIHHITFHKLAGQIIMSSVGNRASTFTWALLTAPARVTLPPKEKKG